MTFKLLPSANEVLMVYRGSLIRSLITNPVGNTEPTEWNTFLFLHNHLQEEDGCIEVDVTSNGLSR